MKHIDRQLSEFRDSLIGEVDLTAEEATKVATLVSAEVRFLPSEVKRQIKEESRIPISARYDELVAFQAWSDFAVSIANRPEISRASVIVQNYVCFTYLKDACFEILAKQSKPGSVTARVTGYLSKGAIRDFRNAFSHANWCYNKEFSGLDCWVLEDARSRDGRMKYFAVSQTELNFWQALSRGVAYAAYGQLRD